MHHGKEARNPPKGPGGGGLDPPGVLAPRPKRGGAGTRGAPGAKRLEAPWRRRRAGDPGTRGRDIRKTGPGHEAPVKRARPPPGTAPKRGKF